MSDQEVLELAERALKQSNAPAAEQALLRRWPDIAKAPPDAIHALGAVRTQQERWGEAEQLFRAALRGAPNALRHHVALGHTLFAAGKFSEAADAFDGGLRIDPRWPGLALVFARAAYEAGRHQEAERAARHALNEAPSADAWDVLSGVLRALGKTEDARSAAKEALRLDPNHIGAHNSLGAALLILGRAQEAMPLFDALLAVGVVSPVLWLNRGAALEMLDRRPEAEAVYADAAARWPNMPNLQQQLAARRR